MLSIFAADEIDELDDDRYDELVDILDSNRDAFELPTKASQNDLAYRLKQFGF